MVLIKRGIVWGEWQRSEACVPIQQSILSAKSYSELNLVIDHHKHWNPEDPNDLDGWVEVLNYLHQVLASLIKQNGKMFLNYNKSQISGFANDRSGGIGEITGFTANLESDVSLAVDTIIHILSFSYLLLSNTCNKDRYSSVELLYVLMRAYDESIVEMTLKVLVALTLPPLTHRHLDYCPHSTVLHKRLPMLEPFLVLLNISSSYITRYSGESLVIDTNFEPPNIENSFEFDNYDSKFATDFEISDILHYGASGVSVPKKTNKIIDLATNYTGVGSVSVPMELLNDSRDIDVIMNEYSSQIPASHQFAFMWKLRLHRWFLGDLHSRRKLVLHTYAIVAVLLCCHPNGDGITSIFEANSQFLRDFIYFLRSGPALRAENVNNSSDAVMEESNDVFNIRLLSCCCVTSIVGWSDTSVASAFHRFTWLQNELGIHKGQYMGLLPCLLRTCSNYLVDLSLAGDVSSMNLENNMAVDAESISSVMDSPFVSRRLQWVEAILSLTMTLVSATSAFLPALTDNGLVASLLSVVSVGALPAANRGISGGSESTNSTSSGDTMEVVDIDTKNKSIVIPSIKKNRSFLQVFVDSLAVQVLDMGVNNHSQTLTTFKEMKGASIVIERLLVELNMLNLSPTYFPPHATKVDLSSLPNLKKLFENAENSSNDDIEKAANNFELEHACEKNDAMEHGESSVISSSSADSTNIDGTSSPRVVITGSHKILIQSLLSLLSSYFFDGKQDTTDREQNQILRSASFTTLFNTLLRNAACLECAVMEPVHRLLADLINNDPATPVVLSYLISSGLAESALVGIRDVKSRHSGESYMATLALVSVFALTAEGKALLFCMEPFSHLFRQFRMEYAVYPISAIFMNETSSLVGSGVEEFIRYYPVFANLIIKTIKIELNAAVREATVLVNENCPVEEFSKYFYYITNYLQILEPLLLKASFTTNFLDCENGNLSGFDLLVDCFNIALGPPKSSLSILACLADPTPLFIGFSPLITTCKRCMQHIGETVPSAYWEALLPRLGVEMDVLRANMASRKEVVSTKGSRRATRSSPRNVVASNDNLLDLDVEGFLTTAAVTPIQDDMDIPMSVENLRYASSLRLFLKVDFILDALVTFGHMHRPASPSAVTYDFLQSLMTYSNAVKLQELFKSFYIPCLKEHYLARDAIARSDALEKLNRHPVYKLVVIVSEAAVRETMDDSSKKLYKLARGAVINAYERGIGSNNSLKYLVDGGWVGLYRPSIGSAQGELQFVVVGVEQQTDFQSSIYSSTTSVQTEQVRFDFEKYANVSPLRAGFMTFYRFLSSIKSCLTLISRSLLVFDPNQSSSTGVTLDLTKREALIVKNFSLLHAESVFSCINKLCGGIDGPLIFKNTYGVTNEFLNGFENGNASPSQGKRGKKRTFDVASLPSSVEFGDDIDQKYRGRSQGVDAAVIHDNFFPRIASDRLPTMDEFSMRNTFATIHAIDAVRGLMYDDKGGSTKVWDFNVVVINQMVCSGSLETIIQGSVALYLCSLGGNDVEIEHPKSASAAGSNASKSKQESVRRIARMIRDRRMYAASKIEPILEFWKKILEFCKSSVTPSDRSLMEFSSNTHYFDPYQLRRKVLIVLVTCVYPVWTHKLLHTALPSAVKGIFEFLSLVLDCFKEIEHFNMQAPAISKKSSKGKNKGSKSVGEGLLNSSVTSSIWGLGGGDLKSKSETNTENSDNRFSETFSKSVTSTEEETVIFIPPSAKSTMPTLKKYCAILGGLRARCISSIIPSFLTTVLENGVTLQGIQWNRHAASMESYRGAEGLPQLLVLLEKSCGFHRLKSHYERILMCSCLCRRAVQILNELQSPCCPSLMTRLFNVLHSILVLVTNKISPRVGSPSIGKRVDIAVSIFRFSPECASLHKALVEKLPLFLGASKQSGPKLLSVPATGWWMTPAFLLIDVLAQPILMKRSKQTKQIFVDLSKVLSPEEFELYWGDDSILPAAPILSVDFVNRLNEVTRGHLEVDSDEVQNKRAKIGTESSFASTNSNQKSRDSGVLGGFPLLDLNLDFELREKIIDAALTGMEELSIDITELVNYAGNVGDPSKCVLESAVGDKEDTSKLTGEEKKRIISVVNSAVQYTQAVLQTLVHLTRSEECRAAFQARNGIQRLLRCSGLLRFEGLTGVMLSLIQQQLENKVHLAQAMECTIRLCINRLLKAKKQAAGEAASQNCVSLYHVLEVVCPLLYRDQTTFIEVMRSITIVKSGGNREWATVQLKESTPVTLSPSDSNENASTSGKKMDSVVKDSVAVTPGRRDRSRRNSSSNKSVEETILTPSLGVSKTDSSAVKSLMHVTPGYKVNSTQTQASSSNGSIATPSVSIVYSIIEELIMMLLRQWCQLKSMEKLRGQRREDGEAYVSLLDGCPFLSITDIILLLADLASYIPGMALCIFKYHLHHFHKSNIAKKNCNDIEYDRSMYAVLELTLGSMKHCITGAKLNSTHFLTFICQELITQESSHIVDRPKPPLCGGDIPLCCSFPGCVCENDHTIVVGSWKTTVMEATHFCISTTGCCSCGGSVTDAASYLIGALVSRPGEGRRRVVNELMSVVNIDAHAYCSGTLLGSTSQMQAVGAIGKTIVGLLYVPVNWSARDSFIVPSKDLLKAFCQMKMFDNLNAIVSRLDLTHPLALDVTYILSIATELMIRKGCLMTDASSEAPAVETNTSTTKSSNVRTPGCSRRNSGVRFVTDSSAEQVVPDSSERDRSRANTMDSNVSTSELINGTTGTSTFSEAGQPTSVVSSESSCSGHVIDDSADITAGGHGSGPHDHLLRGEVDLAADESVLSRGDMTRIIDEDDDMSSNASSDATSSDDDDEEDEDDEDMDDYDEFIEEDDEDEDLDMGEMEDVMDEDAENAMEEDVELNAPEMYNQESTELPGPGQSLGGTLDLGNGLQVDITLDGPGTATSGRLRSGSSSSAHSAGASNPDASEYSESADGDEHEEFSSGDEYDDDDIVVDPAFHGNDDDFAGLMAEREGRSSILDAGDEYEDEPESDEEGEETVHFNRAAEAELDNIMNMNNGSGSRRRGRSGRHQRSSHGGSEPTVTRESDGTVRIEFTQNMPNDINSAMNIIGRSLPQIFGTGSVGLRQIASTNGDGNHQHLEFLQNMFQASGPPPVPVRSDVLPSTQAGADPFTLFRSFLGNSGGGLGLSGSSANIDGASEVSRSESRGGVFAPSPSVPHAPSFRSFNRSHGSGDGRSSVVSTTVPQSTIPHTHVLLETQHTANRTGPYSRVHVRRTVAPIMSLFRTESAQYITSLDQQQLLLLSSTLNRLQAPENPVSLVSTVFTTVNENKRVPSSDSKANPVSARRRTMGPLVSDRRWGTDMGELENISFANQLRGNVLFGLMDEGDRSAALTQMCEFCLKEPTESTSKSKFQISSPAQKEKKRASKTSNAGDRLLALMARGFAEANENKEEGPLIEYKPVEVSNGLLRADRMLGQMIGHFARSSSNADPDTETFADAKDAPDDLNTVSLPTEQMEQKEEEVSNDNCASIVADSKDGVDAPTLPVVLAETSSTSNADTTAADSKDADTTAADSKDGVDAPTTVSDAGDASIAASSASSVVAEAPSNSYIACPEGYDESTWRDLPAEIQMEIVDMDSQAASIDVAGVESNATTSTAAADAVAVSAPNENEVFLNSLSQGLRREVLLTAEEEFLVTLPPAIQAEARRLQTMMGIRAAPVLATGNSTGSEVVPASFGLGVLPIAGMSMDVQGDGEDEDVEDDDGDDVSNFHDLFEGSFASGRRSSRQSGGSNGHGSRSGRCSRRVSGSSGIGMDPALLEIFGGGVSNASHAPIRIPDATSRKCTVSVLSDRLDLKIPFNRAYITRLLLVLLVSRNHMGADRENDENYNASDTVEDKELAASKPNRRMLAVLCRYRAGRFAILPSLIAILIGNVPMLIGCLSMISTESNQQILQGHCDFDPSKSDDLAKIMAMMNDYSVMLNLRRKIWLLVDYLLRKVSPLCWLGFMQDIQTTISMSIRNKDNIFTSSESALSSSNVGSAVNSNLISVLKAHFIDPLAPALFRTPTMFHRVMLLLSSTTGSWDATSGDVLSRVVCRDMSYDYVLHILEELLIPLSSYTIEDAEKAVQRQKLEIFANAISLSEGVISGIIEEKPRGLEDGELKELAPSGSSNGKRVRILESCSTSGGGVDVSGDSGRVVDSPFPMLCDETASAFATLVVSPNTAMTSAFLKRISKVAKVLSLSVENWQILLDRLTPAACILADGVLRELVPLHKVLVSVVEKKGDVRAAMSLPELCIPSDSSVIPDIRLLQVVKLMMTMRGSSAATSSSGAISASSAPASAAPSTSNTPSATSGVTGALTAASDTATTPGEGAVEVENVEDSAVIAKFIRKIDFKNLWDVLCTCLDAVRAVEGIIDPAMSSISASGSDHEREIGASSGKTASSSRVQHDPRKQKKEKPKSDQEEVPVLSSLTMRFMPLIETFFAVCGATMIRFPTAASSSTTESLGNGSKKRQRDDDNVSTEKDSNDHVNEPLSPSNDLSIAPPLQRVNSTGSSRMFGSPSGNSNWLQQHEAVFHTPGERFRQHAGYLRMQCELVDVIDPDSAPDPRKLPLSEQLLLLAEQNKLLINMILRQNISLLESSFSIVILVPRCRHLLHFDVKRTYFKMKLKKMKQDARLNNSNYSGGSVRVNVHRGSVFNDSFQKLAFISADEMRKRLYVSFYEEEAIDAGGVTREWYSLLSREIFNPNYALFSATADGTTFQPNAYSHFNPEHLRYFKFVGRIIGKAMSDGHLLDAHFTRSFYKHILGIPVSFHDIEAVEPDYYKSLKQILEFPLEMLSLELTFTAESNEFGEVKIVDLVPNGSNIAVDDDNKYEYVRLIAHHRMTSGISKQIDAFLEGFHEIIPSELISIFDAQELELMISGLPDIDVDDLRAHTDYHGYKPTDPTIVQFWNTIKSFSKEEIALFLQFVTGTSKVPLDGFGALQGSEGTRQFNIHKAYGNAFTLPSAHTCFNQLDLPEYGSEEILREKLLVAIREGSEGFGFA